ncbi:hypothetical protein HNP84_003782 [Thermocatellispora tengchongensis]|uniref:GerMN domain-containing protein n=1 Tax=Thermocatellispora tengchongensis TaxID=1073253 RepID=A0A840P660_9ACTN|nr:hypothetical protein [Thermocatellispora tengchongensis]MBB5134056.1 hypothetical protein [Thermocatellispora tengchongensis]
MTIRRLLPLVFLPALLLPAGCGIEPSNVADVGRAPVISVEPTLKTVYLLRGKRLQPTRAYVSSGTVEDVIEALFKASARPPAGLHSELDGFSHADTQISHYGQPVRNDPEVPTGLRLHVFVRGERHLSRAAVAQVTCTAMLDKSIWVVKITELSPDRGPRSRGEHVCSEFRDLAATDTQLPP